MEYVIMVPILLMQVVFIPMATGWMMDVWVDQRKETALQDVASHLGSTIQQLYLSLNREEAGAFDGNKHHRNNAHYVGFQRLVGTTTYFHE
jgi:hypothetical protein